jgi:hypothetical protein
VEIGVPFPRNLVSMVTFVDIAQTLDRLNKVTDAVVPALQGALPALEETGREMVRRALASAATTAQQVAPSSMAIGSDLGFDVMVTKVDPTGGLNPKSFTVDGAQGHPWIKEDLANLTHATAEKERHDREHGRRAHQGFINPIPSGTDITPWANPSPPQMREGAQRQSRHPLMKF